MSLAYGAPPYRADVRITEIVARSQEIRDKRSIAAVSAKRIAVGESSDGVSARSVPMGPVGQMAPHGHSRTDCCTTPGGLT